MSALLEVRGISRRFPGAEQVALDGVTFEAREGELVTLMGESGSGKTSLLRILAGLEPADAGEVRLESVALTQGSRILLPPERRHMGFVFQNHALFPHLTVRENVAFGVRNGRGGGQRVADLLRLVGIDALQGRYPHELSGGERQRVALVRALAPNPRLLLMDEPFSSLDQTLREELRDETRRLVKRHNATTILVTHHADDALAISDRIVVLREGTVQQIGTPTEIYRRPVSRYIASSFGPCNFLASTDLADPAALNGFRGIQPESVEQEETWIRPEDLALARDGRPGALASGLVTRSLYHGQSRLVSLECRAPEGGSFELQVRLHGELRAAPGERYQVIPAHA